MTETELADRLERLERDNLRLKRLATGALIIAAALGAIYAARPVPDKIEAHEFEVVDNAGKVRTKLAVKYWKAGDDHFNAPAIQLYDANGSEREELGLVYGGPGLLLMDKHRNLAASLAYDLMGASLSVGSPDRGYVAIGNSRITTPAGPPGPYVRMTARQSSSKVSIENSNGPKISLSGPGGFTMDLGSVGTVNKTSGTTQQTSAASITMFGNDKDHHVIWKAP